MCFATVTPSLVILGGPKDWSKMALRPTFIVLKENEFEFKDEYEDKDEDEDINEVEED